MQVTAASHRRHRARERAHVEAGWCIWGHEEDGLSFLGGNPLLLNLLT